MDISSQEIKEIILKNDTVTNLISRLHNLQMPECYLTAGCLFQSVWNYRSGNDLMWGIKDYDVFYYDPDISWEKENSWIQLAKKIETELEIEIEIKNQARVHLWYKKKFGLDTHPLTSTKDGIRDFLVECCCVGINIDNKELFAPYGLTDLWNGHLRINSSNPRQELFKEKANNYKQRWEWLTVFD